MPAGGVSGVAWRLPNECDFRRPSAVVEKPPIALQTFASRNPTSKLMLTALGVGVSTVQRLKAEMRAAPVG